MNSEDNNKCHCGQAVGADGLMPLHKCTFYDQEFILQARIVGLCAAYFIYGKTELYPLIMELMLQYGELIVKLNELQGIDASKSKIKNYNIDELSNFLVTGKLEHTEEPPKDDFLGKMENPN